MKKIVYIFLAAALFGGCGKKNTTQSSGPADDVAPVPASAQNVPQNPDGSGKKESSGDDNEAKASEIKWMTYEEAVKAAKKKPKKIFIDVYTDWCGWCKKMDKSTFRDPKIAGYVGQKYYAVKLNAESDKAVTFQGKQTTEKQLAGKVFQITGYPSTVYLEADEKIIQPIPGYMDVPTLDKILHYIGEDHYKTQTWEQFQMSYRE